MPGAFRLDAFGCKGLTLFLKTITAAQKLVPRGGFLLFSFQLFMLEKSMPDKPPTANPISTSMAYPNTVSFC